MGRRYTRLTKPLIRDNGSLDAVSWDEALDRAAGGFAHTIATPRDVRTTVHESRGTDPRSSTSATMS